MAPKDPVDACEHFRVAQHAAVCHPDAELEEGLSRFASSFPAACSQADLFASDAEVIAAHARLAQRPPEVEREALRALLNRKRLEYRER